MFMRKVRVVHRRQTRRFQSPRSPRYHRCEDGSLVGFLSTQLGTHHQRGHLPSASNKPRCQNQSRQAKDPELETRYGRLRILLAPLLRQTRTFTTTKSSGRATQAKKTHGSQRNTYEIATKPLRDSSGRNEHGAQVAGCFEVLCLRFERAGTN